MRQPKYTCANCESEKEPYFSRSEPMGFYCADCGRDFDARNLQDAEATAEHWIQKAKEAEQAADDLKSALRDAKRHWKEETEEQARLLGMSAERECDLRGKIERLERERDAERALADRLHGALDALDYNLAFAGNTLIGGLRERVTAMRAIALPAIEAWKEARGEKC